MWYWETINNTLKSLNIHVVCVYLQSRLIYVFTLCMNFTLAGVHSTDLQSLEKNSILPHVI